MKSSGAEIIIKLLEIHGICQIAGIPGGANLPMYDALARSGRIRHVLARHEQGAGFIAQGQARSTGKVGVFFATFGPGSHERTDGDCGCQAGLCSDHLHHRASSSGVDRNRCFSGDRYLWIECSDHETQLFCEIGKRTPDDYSGSLSYRHGRTPRACIDRCSKRRTE